MLERDRRSDEKRKKAFGKAGGEKNTGRRSENRETAANGRWRGREEIIDEKFRADV